MITNIIKAIICHVVGDYLFQTDYMAREKDKDWYVLFVHCVCYCVPFIYVFGLDFKTIILFLTHMIIVVLKARYRKLGIYADQILHYQIALMLYTF